MNRNQIVWLLIDLGTMAAVAVMLAVIFHIGVMGALACFAAQVIFFMLFLLPLYRKT